MTILKPQPLTKAAFAAYGDVIETADRDYFLINNDSTQRYHKLASVQLSAASDQAIISIFRARSHQMPLPIKMMERHPRGSQAFIPLNANEFLIVVAPAGEPPEADQLQAFITDGTQGINYHTGVWHHPILSLIDNDEFLVVDRQGEGDNCDEHFFAADTEITLDPTDVLAY
ncbi:MAG: ureidoglycolate lyase [Pseudomonadales bacterium]|nr:ureidoglycolate lyase [Pseudomonadales bacterium]NRA18281.1 ureidoglycolate lyase [Oceanospirillaceae bacterium]